MAYTRLSRVQKPRGHAKHACHANTAGDMQQRVSTRAPDPEPPISPTGSTKSYPDGTDGLESHTNMPNVCGKAHGDASESRRPANVSASPNLPARGAELRVHEPERLESQTDASDTPARRVMGTTE